MKEFARNHSASFETQRKSRETTAGASKPRPRPTARAVAVGNLSDPPRRGLKRPREAGIRAKPQREHRNATEFARNHSGSVETKAPSHRARRCGRQPKWPLQKRPSEATRGRNSRETTARASKRNGICAKPQREHRNQGPVPPPRAPLRSATNSFTLNVRTPLCKHCLGKKALEVDTMPMAPKSAYGRCSLGLRQLRQLSCSVLVAQRCSFACR